MPTTLRHHLFCILTCLLLQACSGEQNVSEATEESVDTRPNILLIVADDLGYADLGFYGSEIPTPNHGCAGRQRHAADRLFQQPDLWPHPLHADVRH